MKVKCVRVKKGVTNEIDIKQDYDEDYKTIHLQKEESSRATRTSNSKMSSPVTVNIVVDQSLLKPAYTHPLPITASKKGGLLKLCSTGAITASKRGDL